MSQFVRTLSQGLTGNPLLATPDSTFRNALQLPNPTTDPGKANSHIGDAVFNYVAICAELWPINSLEVLSSPPRISPISQRALTLHPNPDCGKANSLIEDKVFHYVVICAELSPMDSLEILS